MQMDLMSSFHFSMDWKESHLPLFIHKLVALRCTVLYIVIAMDLLRTLLSKIGKHLAYINELDDLIINCMCKYLYVELKNWNGECSSGCVLHVTLFTDAAIDKILFDELASHQLKVV